jgi:replicative DNA helicase
MPVEQLIDRIPPQNLEAEACVLGSILLDNETAALVVPYLRKEHFYKTAHQLIYEAIIDLVNENKAVDAVILRDELERKGKLEEVGGTLYLTEIMETVPSAANAEYYAGIVRDKSSLRSLIRVSTEIIRDAYEAQDSTAEILDRAEKHFFEVTQKRVASQALPISEVLKETFDLIDSLHGDGSGVTGLSTGFYDLNEITNGFQPSELAILAGRPSMGKTTLALNILENIGVEQQRPAAFFSLEMSKQQVAQNLLCLMSGVDAHKMRKGMLEDSDWHKLSREAGRLSEAPIFIDDTPGLSTMELRAKARRLKAFQNIQLVVLDYLQLMEVYSRAESRQQEISMISRMLKSLARELEIPVLALSQLSRAVEARESHRPRLSDLRESGAIEQDADLVMLMYREEYYKPEKEEAKRKAEVIVAKQRNGPTGSVQLIFLKEFLKFGDPYRDV